MNLLKFLPSPLPAVKSDARINQGNNQNAMWRLVWQDEFNIGSMPDPAKWNSEIGFVRNEELQYYTGGAYDNAFVINRMLVIKGAKERIKNPKYEPASTDWRKAREYAEYTSASITTMGRASWLFGRIEVRARIPKGKGAWPAIWMMGENRPEVGWPLCGEIDIMEYVGKEPNSIYGTVHYRKQGESEGVTSIGNKFEAEKPYDDFHVYAIEWDYEKIDFCYDDVCYHTFRIDNAGIGDDNPFRRPCYLLINLAMGGNWAGDIDEEELPFRYCIDYVRVYERMK